MLREMPIMTQNMKQPMYRSTHVIGKLGSGSSIAMIVMYVLLGIYLLGHLLFLPMEIVAIGFFSDPTLVWFCVLYVIALLFKYTTIVLLFITCANYHKFRADHTIDIIFAIIMFIALALNTTWFVMVIINLEKYGFSVTEFIQEPLFYDFVIFAFLALYGIVWLIAMECNVMRMTNYTYGVPHAGYIPVPQQVAPLPQEMRQMPLAPQVIPSQDIYYTY